MARKISRKQLKNSPRPRGFFWQRWIRSLALGTIPAIFSVIPVNAAQTIYFYYGPLGFSIEVDSLELFAKEGKINSELDFYLSRVEPEAQAKFRQVLVNRQEVNPVQLYRFFRTPLGEELLNQIGNLINIPGGRNGKYAIRAALGKAAFDSEGLTLLNFLRQFPTDIELNTDRILEVARLVELLVKGTEWMVAQMTELSSVEAANSTSVDFSKLPDLRLTGKYGYIKQTIALHDKSRQRKFKVDIYKPKKWRPGKTPVVIASHGLATDSDYFEKRGKHLASYGYLVAVPQHPGSNFNQLQEMLQGYSQEVFKLNEFIDRPLDISYVLDELERRNETEFEERLDLESVGVMGHSFGGYTALAIAGAQINFEQLEQDCQKVIWDPNLSLLVQCRALKLPRQNYNFRDRRVKVILIANPVNSTIFGAKGLSQIEIPVVIGAGSRDPATPAVLEQVRSFTWLTTADKYLILIEGHTHIDISILDAGATKAIESLSELKLPDSELLDRYGNAIIVAFFEYYIANNRDYFSYLQSSYAQYLSEQPFSIYLIGSSSVEALVQAIEDFKLREGIDER
ncbi:MAG: alpha/beta hydrolase [Prochloraceae cyanobacterium]